MCLFLNIEENGKKDRSTASKEKREVTEKKTKSIKNVETEKENELQGKTNAADKTNVLENAKATVASPAVVESAKKSIVTVAEVHNTSESKEASAENSKAIIAETPDLKNDIKDPNQTEVVQKSNTVQPSAVDQNVSDPTKPTESSANKTTEQTSAQESKPVESVGAAPLPDQDAKDEKKEKEEKKQEAATETKTVEESSQEKPDDTSAKVATDITIQADDQISAKKDQASAMPDSETAKAAQDVTTEQNDGTKSTENAAEPNKTSQSDDNKAKDQTDETNQAEKKGDAVDDAKSNVDASKSFQVLPIENQQSDNLNQEIDDTGNLELPKPPTETIRKTSFTVLKSDESIDDILAGMDENQNKEMKSETGTKTLTRPKSFKILKSHDPSGEDIILHQSSDQETGGNENFEDYLNRNLTYGGKYSDSELVKSDSHFNGRRKKYKKRAKSVKQLTIVDGLSKDADSGFEPSPRTLRSSQKAQLTRAIYTASLPERPRVGDTVDGRSASSRFDQSRKPGDKSAVNMSTVSQTLQRNIRRYNLI